jgi:hypothetical protein
MSGGAVSHEEEVKEMNKWKVITFAGTCSCCCGVLPAAVRQGAEDLLLLPAQPSRCA